MNQAGNAVKRTGVVGLGAMGLQMGRHMANKGFSVAGYDIDAEAMQRAQAQGPGVVQQAGCVFEPGRDRRGMDDQADAGRGRPRGCSAPRGGRHPPRQDKPAAVVW